MFITKTRRNTISMELQLPLVCNELIQPGALLHLNRHYDNTDLTGNSISGVI